jgi:hypothetical protein
MVNANRHTAYHTAMTQWFPGVQPIRGRPGDPLRVRWRGPAGKVEFRVHEEPHLATRDVHLVVNRLKAQHVRPAPRGAAPPRLLLLAPYVRPQQAAVFEREEVDYLDLAGNAHVDVPGLRVHVEGKRPQRPDVKATTVTAGWVRFVLALLVRPELANGPYRVLAERAGVALGAVTRYRHDLERRGFIEGRHDRARLVRHRDLIPMWVQAYETTLRPRLAEQHFRTPRTVKPDVRTRLRDRLGARGLCWTLTGADAAFLVDHYLETTDTRIFVQPGALTPEVLGELRAQPTAGDGDLVAIDAPGPLALDAVMMDGWPCAPLPLVYAELRYLGTEQAGEAADRLMPRLLEATA